MAAQFVRLLVQQGIFSITAGMRATTTETAYNAIAMGNGASAASEDAVVVGSNSAARTGDSKCNRIRC